MKIDSSQEFFLFYTKMRMHMSQNLTQKHRKFESMIDSRFCCVRIYYIACILSTSYFDPIIGSFFLPMYHYSDMASHPIEITCSP